MSASIEPFRADRSGVVRTRKVARAVKKLDENEAIGVAEIDTIAELSRAKVAALGYLTRGAVADITLTTRYEQEAAMLAPAASGRLAAACDTYSLAVCEVIATTAHRMKRL